MKYPGRTGGRYFGDVNGGYKHIDTSPRFLAVDLQRQLLPGTFEHALNHLLDHELDLTGFDTRFCNDETGAAAYSPAILLKIVLFAYAQDIVSSRNIERACREHVTFIALSGDSQPHFTTLAGFVSSLGDNIARIFTQILFICDRQGLIGREMFAIDGVKLPSNASKAKSGTRADFERQAGKLETAARVMLERHRAEDRRTIEPDLQAKETQRITRLQTDEAQLREWLTDHPEDRKGSKGALRKSNRTDNDSAKMANSKGVMQGYTGVAAVDARHQIIVEAQAHGTGSEQGLLIPVVKAIQATQINSPLITGSSLITADAGYHSEANLKELANMNIDALIADNGMRQRNDRFAGQDKYKALPDPIHDKEAPIMNTTLIAVDLAKDVFELALAIRPGGSPNTSVSIVSNSIASALSIPRSRWSWKTAAPCLGVPFWLALLGIVTLAFAVNLVDLFRSAGIPAVYTQMLALSRLPAWLHHVYLALYILVFTLDDLVVFVVAVNTLQITGMTTRYSRFSIWPGASCSCDRSALLRPERRVPTSRDESQDVASRDKVFTPRVCGSSVLSPPTPRPCG
jgi:transposase